MGLCADPRFEETAGKVNEDTFRQNYEFLNEYKDSEIKALKKELYKTREPEAKAEMQGVLTKLQQQRSEEQRRDKLREVSRQVKHQEAERVAQGKAPYFPKRRELKELADVTSFASLERKGGAAVDKALKKRRKKITAKDRKWLPPPPKRGATD